VFIVSGKKWHFDEFLHNLNKSNFKISKPTLSKHLKHLQKLKLITRKKEGKQQTSYDVNWEVLKHIKTTVERDAIKRITENKKLFSSLPIDDQVMYLTNILSLRNLEELRLYIIDIMEPEYNFEHNVQYAFIHQFYDSYKTWFLLNCHATTNENKRVALKMVENNIEHFQEKLFDKKPWTSSSSVKT
jgi:DNA-binding HxlR family transcriptional regulator